MRYGIEEDPMWGIGEQENYRIGVGDRGALGEFWEIGGPKGEVGEQRTLGEVWEIRGP